MRRPRALLVILAVAGCVGTPSRPTPTIPARPEQLGFAPLHYRVPDTGALRTTLSNGVPVYIAEDRLLPLVTVQILFRGGCYLEPVGREGLAALTSTVWRSGGAGEYDPQAFDEELDYLAAQLSTEVGGVDGSVTLNLLSKDIDRGLGLLMEVLERPRFDAARLSKAKEEALADMKRRNDDTADIEEREWNRLIYGDDYWINRLATKASVEGIGREDLLAFQQRLANPANFVVAVAGDFGRPAMIAKLDATIGALGPSGPAVPPVPQPTHVAKPGVYLIDKPEVNQGRVSIGHLGVKRPLPDEFPLEVANDILGGDSFTAWMMSRVRSDEGLAYSAFSLVGIGDLYPKTFRAFFQSKSATCARAAQLTEELIAKLRSRQVTEKELATSKNSFVANLPRTFESKLATVKRFATDELIGLPHEHWSEYRARMEAVDASSVQAAARAHIEPERFVVLVVGNVDDILRGSPDYPGAKFERLGGLVRVPLRDPLTLQPTS